MGQPIPLTPTPMEISYRVEDFPQIDLARASSSLARLGRGEQRFHEGPLLVRQIGWLMLSDWFSFNIAAHSSAHGICAHYPRSLLFCQALFPDSL